MLRGKRLQAVYAVQSLLGVGEEGAGCGCPDECQRAFGNHRAVEDPSSLSLVGYAACHQRRLRAVKARDGAAGNADEHHREEGQAVGLTVVEPIAQFRHLAAVPA